MKTYTGERTFDGVVVEKDGQPLAIHFDVKPCSSNGFEWGFEGSAAEQLAVALLADAVDANTARQCSKPFMKRIVANFANEWEMTDTQIQSAAQALSNPDT